MDNYTLILVIILPVFAIIIAMLYFLVIRDANSSIAAYEKKTGKKIVSKPISIDKDFEEKLVVFEKLLTKPLTVKPPKKKENTILGKLKNKKKNAKK